MSITEQLLNTKPISRIRRNHGLEHATLHVLANRHPGKRMAGYSDLSGFWIVADLPGQEIKDAADEALQRLSQGEHKLAVHPNCGTNFATAGSLAGNLGIDCSAALRDEGPTIFNHLRKPRYPKDF